MTRYTILKNGVDLGCIFSTMTEAQIAIIYATALAPDGSIYDIQPVEG